MKKFLFFIGALTIVLFFSCSNDNQSDDFSNLILPRKISYSYPEQNLKNVNDKTITYKGNKILAINSIGNKKVYTYEGNMIVKEVSFFIDEMGKEFKAEEVSYYYDKGKLITKTGKSEFYTSNPNESVFYNKVVYTHISNNEISYVSYIINQTNVETKSHEGTLYYNNGNLVKHEQIYDDFYIINTYEYDNKNNYANNILGFNLLLETNKYHENGNNTNNVIKATRNFNGEIIVETFNYTYNDNEYPLTLTLFKEDGITISQINEYSY